MKIATWNVERLKYKNALPKISEICERIRADIFVLTETDSALALNYTHCYPTSPLADKTVTYQNTEHRVTIYTNYKVKQRYETFDNQTAVCVELMTDYGDLLVYGVVMGIYGNRHKNYMTDLSLIIADISKFAKVGKHLCVSGDFNCSFSDNYYYTKAGRSALEDMMSNNDIELLTRNQPECIDHVAMSRKFIDTTNVKVEEWNINKKLSDHKGIFVELMPLR